MRVLVYGGADYADRAAVFSALDRLHAQRGIEAVITGDKAKPVGAGSIAAEWAQERAIELWTFLPDLGHLGHAARPMRNHLMLEHGRPDGVVEFPGDDDAGDMRIRARHAGLRVWRPIGNFA